MHTLTRFAVATVAPALLAITAFAGNKPEATPAPTPFPQWDVRIEVLMVDMPQEKALALLPDLNDPAKIDGATAQIIDAVNRKEATLVGYPVVETEDGQRAVAETVLEKRYPTEFCPPMGSQVTGTGQPATTGSSEYPIPYPTAFETRNTGVTFEVEPEVLKNGKLIHLNLVPQRVKLLTMEPYDIIRLPDGAIPKVVQPLFATSKVTMSTILRNGERRLIAVHKLDYGENQIELFILKASATPINP